MEIKPIYGNSAIKVIAICGSLAPSSYTSKALETALIGASEMKAKTQFVDLSEYTLPFYDGRKQENYPPDVVSLRKTVRAAHAVILGTPEYHGSYSGVLKNALDLMRLEELEGKIVGLIGVSQGGMGAINAINGLRIVAQALRAWVIPQQISIPRAHELFNEEGYLKSGHLEQRVLDIGRQVTQFATLRSNKQFAQFVQKWESNPAQPDSENVYD